MKIQNKKKKYKTYDENTKQKREIQKQIMKIRKHIMKIRNGKGKYRTNEMINQFITNETCRITGNSLTNRFFDAESESVFKF